MSPLENDLLTPYELNLIIKDYSEKRKEKLKENITHAFYCAYFNLKGQKGLKGQDLEDVLNKINNPTKKEMNDEELFNQIKKLHSKFGGE